MQGKLVAGVDSQVQIYRFFEKGVNDSGAPELALQCEHNGHIMSLFCKTAGDLILVGDILRSMLVLQHKESPNAAGVAVTTVDEISRDFNSNYMRAVEILDDQLYQIFENKPCH